MTVPALSRTETLKSDLRDLFSFFMPVFMEQLFISVCSIITSSTIGGLGAEQVSAFNLVEVVSTFLIQVYSSMAVGVAVTVSQYRGKRDYQSAGRVAVNALWFFSAASIVLTCGVIVFNRPILLLVMGEADPLVMEYGRIHLLLCSCALPLYMIYQTGVNSVRGAGYPRRTMVDTVLTNIIYAVLAWVFVKLGFGMYSPGIALILARGYGAVHGVIMMKHCGDTMVIPSLKLPKINWRDIRTVLSLGIPLSIENMIFQGGRLLTMTMIVPFGTNPLAANGIANNMATLILVPTSAMSNSLVPVVGSRVGEGNYKRAKSVTINAIVLTTLMLSVTSLATYLLMDPFIGLYKQSEEVNAISRSLFAEYLIIMPLIYALSFNLPNALRAAGDVRFNTYGAVGSMVIFRLVCSYVLCRYTDIGVKSIWYGMYLDWIVRTIYFGARFLSGRWTKKRVV